MWLIILPSYWSCSVQSCQCSLCFQNLIFFSVLVLLHFLANTATIHLFLFYKYPLLLPFLLPHLLIYHWPCFILYHLCLLYSNFKYWNNSSGCSLLSILYLQSQSTWAHPVPVLNIIYILRTPYFFISYKPLSWVPDLYIKWPTRCVNSDAYSASQELLIPTALAPNISLWFSTIILNCTKISLSTRDKNKRKQKQTNKNAGYYPSLVLIPYSLHPAFNLSASSMTFISKTYFKSIHVSLSPLKTHLFWMPLSTTQIVK